MDAPPGIRTVAGTVNALGSELTTSTTNPPAGAGATSSTVPTATEPLATRAGRNVICLRMGPAATTVGTETFPALSSATKLTVTALAGRLTGDV